MQNFVLERKNDKERNPTGMDLNSFLIMPIQRIPRYKLLLSEVLKHTDPDHPDFANLTKALKEVDEVAKKINDNLREQANRDKIVAISRQFAKDPCFVGPSRRFLLQGELIKKCRIEDRRYEFFLFNDMLAYAVKLMGGRYKLHRSIPIDSTFMAVDLPDLDSAGAPISSPSISSAADVAAPAPQEGRRYRFQIHNQDKSFEVYSQDKALKMQWISTIVEAVAEQQRIRAELDRRRGVATQVRCVCSPCTTPLFHTLTRVVVSFSNNS